MTAPVPTPIRSDLERVAAGKRLYTAHCSSCHGVYSQSSKRPTSVEALGQALVQQPSMTHLNLSDEDVKIIVVALNWVEIKEPGLPPVSEEQLIPLIEGQRLYSIYCNACHGPVDLTNKRGASAEDISYAISSISEMLFLADDFTSLQLGYIEAALALSQEEKLKTSNAALKSLQGNRRYMASVMRSLFLPVAGPGVEDLPILSIIENNIESQAQTFGGPCRRTDNCVSGLTRVESDFSENLDASVAVSEGAKITRMGYRIRVCEEILELDRAVLNMAGRLGRDFHIAPAVADLEPLYRLFYPGKPISSELAGSMEALLTKSKQLSFSPENQWRFLAVPLCESANLDLL